MRRRADAARARAFAAARLALIASGASVARSFGRALDRPAEAQDAVLRRILRDFVGTGYGRRFGLSPADGYARFAARVPIVGYEDVAPWIARQMAGEDRAIAVDVALYERTSGSSGAVKHVPYTRALRRSFERVFRLWAYDLLTGGPRLSYGQLYFSVSPSFPDARGAAEGGAPIGLDDDADYLSGWLRVLVAPFLAAPTDLKRLHDPRAFRTALALSLLSAAHLELVSVWSPSFFLVLLEDIEARRTELSRALALRGRPERAALLSGGASFRELWPDLRLISCWASAASAERARLLAEAFPGALVQGKGLLATEAPITHPLVGLSHPVPLVGEVLLELEDEEGRVSRVDEIPMGADGREYEVIVSQTGGLVRYRLGDRLVVAGRHRGVPLLEFVGRGGDVSDLVGEKLHERFVGSALADLSLPAGAFRVLVPREGQTPRYVLLVDARAREGERSGDVLAARLDALLQRGHHYRVARQLGQLDRAEIAFVARAEDRVMGVLSERGMKLGDIKDRSLIARADDARRILDATRAER